MAAPLAGVGEPTAIACRPVATLDGGVGRVRESSQSVAHVAIKDQL
ncbi:hypothetical protein FAIPA1_100074 [Frankia sp. AiPs1]